MRRAGVVLLLAMAAAWLPIVPSRAQESSATEAPAPAAVTELAPPGPASKEVAPFPESEVPRAAIAAETRIRAIRSLAGRTHETDAIAASEKAVLDSVRTLEGWMSFREPRQQTPRALRSISQEWRVNEETLGTWMESTGHRLDALSSARAELRDLEAGWTATASTFAAGVAPDQIREHAYRVLNSIREADALVGAQIETVLLLQSRISAARLATEEALDKIAAALREDRQGLLTVDSPPIWKMIRSQADRIPASDELRAAVSEGAWALSQYASRAQRQLWFQFLLFVGLVVAFHRLRPESRTWPPEDKGLRAFARLVERPVLGAFLVALLCGLWIHPRAPLAFYELTSLLLIVPVVILMRGIVRLQSRAGLYAVAVIFAVERMWELTWAGSFLERALLLGLTVSSGAVLAWTLRSRGPFPQVVAQRWWRAVRVAGRFAMAALAASVIANILGNVSLARLLTTTVVRAGYGAVVLYAAALLLRGAAGLLVRSAAAGSIHTIGRHRELILRRAAVVIDAAMVFLFLILILRASDLMPVVRELAGETVTKEWGIGNSRFSIAAILVFAAAVYASVLASRLIRAVLEEDVYPRISLPRGIPGTLTMLARYGVISIGLLLALSITGIPIDRLAIVLGALSVGIGFGLQTVVNNFVSGLILMFERPIQIGDTVEVGGLTGRVRKIGVRASTIETFDGADVIVPNSMLVSERLVNWTLTSRSRRIEVQVGVAYGSDTDRVLALLCEAIKEQPGVLAVPEPTAIFRGFGASALDFSVLFWTAEFDGWPAVRSAAAVKIYRALREAGIEIPFPQSEVRLRR
jgi:small-conductance mechanosensitive channel